MCKALIDGGHRCPIHQHQNIAAIKTAASASGLTKYQTERLFSELRREGRNAAPITEAKRINALIAVRAAAEGTDVFTSVVSDLTKSVEYDRALDGPSAYALRLIIDRAKDRGDKLKRRFNEIAEKSGLTSIEIAEKYKDFMTSFSASQGLDFPGEYNQNTRRRAVLAGMPYDQASVVALERLNTLITQETQRRITLMPVESNSQLHSYGYNDGRVEVTFAFNPEIIYAYQNVPEKVWKEFTDSPTPGLIYSRVICGNDDYMYKDQKDANSDAYNFRCGSCGQFRAAGHSCPERIRRLELESAGLSPSQIIETVEAEKLAASKIIPEPETLNKSSETNNAAEPFVLAAPDLPAQNPFIAEKRNVEIKRDFTNFYYSKNAVENNEYIPTKENQFAPDNFDRDEKLLVESITDTGQINIIKDIGSHMLWSVDELPKDQREEIANSPKEISHIVVRGDDRKLKILRSYDNNEYIAASRFVWAPGQKSKYVCTLHRKGKTAVLPPLFTAEEHNKALIAEKESFEALMSSGKLQIIQGTVTETRKYVFDKNRHAQPFLRVGKVTELKRAIKENKVALMPISVRLSDRLNITDDQGFKVENIYDNIIKGEVALRKNADGVIEVISSGRMLQCNCYDYRSSYRCQHINYVQRHIGNVAQQMIPPAASTRSDGDPGRHRLLNSALERRDDVTIVAGTKNERGEKIEDYVSFGDVIGARSKTAYLSDLRSRFKVTPKMATMDTGQPTAKEISALTELSQTARAVRYINIPVAPNAIRSALKRSDVSIPIKVNFDRDDRFHGYGPGSTVTGTMKFGKERDDLENVVVKSRNLKCTCEDYVANYDCKHVRFVAGQGFAVLSIGSHTESTGDSLQDFTNIHATRIKIETEIQKTMQTDGVSRKRAQVIIEEREATRIREEQERIIARDRERAEREERYAQQRRDVAAAMIATNKETVENTAVYRDEMIKKWGNRDENYSQNPKQFHDDYTAALKRKDSGEAVIPFRTENVTDGTCADIPGARKFGVELEFDIKSGVNKSIALRKIGVELEAAGLTENSRQLGYHSASSTGWKKWSFEQDCTVAGEIVSPLMSDTAEDWKQLQTVCDIVNHNGGIASVRSGSHVNVSSASYGLSTAKNAALLGIVDDYKDPIFRLASNPKRGKHRGMQWCPPNVLGEYGDIDDKVEDGHRVLGYSTRVHAVALNFESASDPEFKKSHVEFRMWDATLDAANIQVQVAISAATVDAAERKVIENKGFSRPTIVSEEIGTNRVKETAALAKIGKKVHNEDSFKESSASAAEFLDTIFRRKEDRAIAAALFAVTKWQSG